MSLRKQMALGAFWVFLEKGGQQLASFVVFTIIARLIGPEEYGLVALCGLFIAVGISVVNGIVDAVISLRVKDDLRLSTLFWLVLFCGFVLSLISYALSGVFARLMGSERLEPLLEVFAILPVLFALAAVPTVLVSSSMNFRVFTIRTLIASVVGGAVGIAMAIKDYGAFALAVQQIVFYVVMNVIVWPGCGWRPRLLFKLGSIPEILRLGMHQVGSSLVGCLDQQAPRMLLGYFISPIAVGQYTFVLRICGAFQEIFIQPLLAVIYPAFALVRDDRAEQEKILAQVIMLFGALVFPIIALAMVTAPVYLPLLFGSKWETTTPLLQLMLVSVISGSLGVFLRDFLRAHKLIGAFFRWQTVVVLGGLLLSAVAVFYGLLVFMVVGIVLSFVAAIAYTILVARKTGILLWPQYASLFAPLVASMIMYGAVFGFMHSSLRPENVYLLLLSAGGIGVAIYGIVYETMQYRQTRSLISFISKMRKRAAAKEALAIPEDIAG